MFIIFCFSALHLSDNCKHITIESTSIRKSISELPEVTCKILEDDCEGMKKGDVVIGDRVSQYLLTLRPGKKPQLVIVCS